MKLSWKKEEMLKHLQALNNKETLNEYERGLTNFYISNLLNVPTSEIMKDDEEVKLLNEEEIANLLRAKCLEFERFLNYLPKRVYNNLFNLIDCLKTLYLDSYEIKRKNKKVTEQELFDTSYEIFGRIFPYLLKTIDYIYEKGLIEVKKITKEV